MSNSVFPGYAKEDAPITAMKQWIHPSAALADHEPLFDGLRQAGVRD